MRQLLPLLAACGTDLMMPPTTPTPDAPAGPPPAFEIQSVDVTLAPNQEVTYCFYFHTPNTSTVSINKWVSSMTPGSHHMIFFTGGTAHADGLDTTNSCGFGNGTSSQWVYASQVPDQEQDLPADDGTGKPLAQDIAPNTQGAFQMHYLNSTDQTLVAHVDLKAYALAAGTAYTPTDAFVTYNADLNIPPGAVNSQWSATCPLPAAVRTGKFWTMTTHAHKQAIEADVRDGSTTVVTSTDWEHPTVQLWPSTPFDSFASSNFTWSCTYNNTGTNSAIYVKACQSAQTCEMCMGIGYYFPSSGAKGCLYKNGSCLCTP